jgi:hypothetical protein
LYLEDNPGQHSESSSTSSKLKLEVKIFKNKNDESTETLSQMKPIGTEQATEPSPMILKERLVEPNTPLIVAVSRGDDLNKKVIDQNTKQKAAVSAQGR